MGNIRLSGNTNAFIWMLLLHFSALKRSHGLSVVLIQAPGKVEVMVGQPVVLECSTKGVISDIDTFYCHAVSWLKVHPSTGRMETVTFKNDNQKGETCEVTITNATKKDSGVYYCLVKPDQFPLYGNGSSVIVTDNDTISVELVSSSDSEGGTTLFICMATGVVSSEIRIFWIVDGEGHVGFTESVWSEKEITQSRFRLSDSAWQAGAQCTCVVETRGENISKTIQCGSMCLSSCSYLVYGISGSVLFAVIMAVISAVILCQSRQISSKSRRADNRRPNSSMSPAQLHGMQRGNRGTHNPRSSEKEVQYASLNQIRLGQASRARLQ